MNILILSVGTRNKIVQYFKKEVNNKGIVVATDANVYAPALYEADYYYVVPKITDANYLETIFSICETHKIDAVLSLIDPELSLLSKNASLFLERKIKPIISEYELVELSFDKLAFYNYMRQNNIKTVLTYGTLDEFMVAYNNHIIDFPVFVKPRNGSASINTNKIANLSDLESIFRIHDNLIIQEFIDGKEFGADVYIDMISNEVTSIFLKEKIIMRAGETDKSRSVMSNKAFELIYTLIEKIKYSGVIDIDIFEKNGEYLISEVNPRFGGGYPHAYECGINIPKSIINNLQNITNIKKTDYKENTIMMKYNEIIMIEKK